MLDIRERSKNIEELNKIVNVLEKNESFAQLKKDLNEFKDEFLKQLKKEKEMKDIQQSKILAELKNKKN